MKTQKMESGNQEKISVAEMQSIVQKTVIVIGVNQIEIPKIPKY